MKTSTESSFSAYFAGNWTNENHRKRTVHYMSVPPKTEMQTCLLLTEAYMLKYIKALIRSF